MVRGRPTKHSTVVRALQGARTSLARPAPEPGLRALMPSTSAHGEPEPRGSAATCNAWRTSTANLDCFLFRGASRRLRQEDTIKTSFRGTLAFFLFLRRRLPPLKQKQKQAVALVQVFVLFRLISLLASQGSLWKPSASSVKWHCVKKNGTAATWSSWRDVGLLFLTTPRFARAPSTRRLTQHTTLGSRVAL